MWATTPDLGHKQLWEDNLAAGHIAAGNVAHRQVLDLGQAWWIANQWIGIGTDQSPQSAGIRRPGENWCAVHIANVLLAGTQIGHLSVAPIDLKLQNIINTWTITFRRIELYLLMTRRLMLTFKRAFGDFAKISGTSPTPRKAASTLGYNQIQKQCWWLKSFSFRDQILCFTYIWLNVTTDECHTSNRNYNTE